MTSALQQLRTPVLFLTFNRPDATARVFERIRATQPEKLFIATDGPRPDKTGEDELCNKTRQLVLDGVDWQCEVRTLFHEKNLGCKLAVSSAITWFFEQIEEGIVLEDDCLPDLSFFRFCEELLEKYRNDERIMMIAGDNTVQPVKRGNASYYFSRYTPIWGWATWKRAWNKFDLKMEKWPEIRADRQFSKFLPPSIYKQAERQLDLAFSGNLSAWSAPWRFAVWSNSGLSIQPNTNMITNIGPDGTHMKVYDPFIMRPAESMEFPLTHPDEVSPNEEADRYRERYVTFRSWKTASIMMLRYLWKSMCNNPTQLPTAFKRIASNCLAEIRHRVKIFRLMRKKQA